MWRDPASKQTKKPKQKPNRALKICSTHLLKTLLMHVFDACVHGNLCGYMCVCLQVHGDAEAGG